ncbi:hypothetical protein FHG87_022891 [Trinorchestia longiramus]|nr:hypothetical protein FHG87_022891 [Trinorchestia longiramus]
MELSIEPTQNTEQVSKATLKYCKECQARYSLQFFNVRDSIEEDCRFFYVIHESSTLIENQSRKMQELSLQLKLLAGRLKTIKQNHQLELRLQSMEAYRGKQLPIDNQPQLIEAIDNRPEIINNQITILHSEPHKVFSDATNDKERCDRKRLLPFKM